MFKKLCCCLIAWIACFLPALAEEHSANLFPTEKDGKWGYCDETGNVVVTPQWDQASKFYHGIAAVCTSYEYGKHNYTSGLINLRGEFVLEPIYLIDDEADIFSISQKNNQGNYLSGYFDKESGFYLAPQYAHVRDNFPVYTHRPNSWLIAARSAETGKWGFLRRTTGEIILPFIYDDVLFTFSNGYALVVQEAYPMDAWMVIDEKGRALQFGEGISAAWGPAANGIVIIEKNAESEKELENTLWGTVYGLANTKEEIVLSPCYGLIEWLSDTQYAFCTADELWGVINEKGEVIIPAQYQSQQDLIDQYNLDIPGIAD